LYRHHLKHAVCPQLALLKQMHAEVNQIKQIHPRQFHIGNAEHVQKLIFDEFGSAEYVHDSSFSLTENL